MKTQQTIVDKAQACIRSINLILSKEAYGPENINNTIALCRIVGRLDILEILVRKFDVKLADSYKGIRLRTTTLINERFNIKSGDPS